MPETVAIAAQATGAPGWLDRFSGTQESLDGLWPVWRDDLDRVIREEAEKKGMRVLSVEEPPRRRGPIPIHNVVDGHMTDEVVAEAAQLYTYVEWEPRATASAAPDS